MSWPWSQLGLSGPSELSEVRHAYAEKLKTTHPEEDPEGFQRLHSAYQLASRMARQQKRRAAASTPEPQRERERPSQPEPGRSGEDLAFDELPERDETPPHSRRGPEEEQDFDFDELLERDETPPHFRRGPEEERDFDFDELLEQDETPRRPPREEEKDFDFERLFAEGEAERAEARRRRGEERRKAHEREFQEGRREWSSREERPNLQFRQEEERWQGTETILHTIEMMYNSQAGGEQWRKFFSSPLFQQNKGSLDLIFGLEDFVSTKSLSQEVRLTLFLTYGFDKGVSRPELRPLFQLLLPAWKAERSSKSRQRIHNVFGGFGGIVGIIVIGMIVTSNYFPGFIILGGLAVYGLTKGWFKREVEKLNGRRKTNWYRVCFAAGMVIAAVLMIIRLTGMWDKVEVLLPTSDPREQVCRYIDQDFGVEAGAMYNRNPSYAIEAYDNVFYLKSNLERVFLAGPDGERDGANTGYTTNLPEMMMRWAMKDFAASHDIIGVDSLDFGLRQYETNGTFLITLPFYGAGDVITALGERLEELSHEKWYQARTPEVELVLCGSEMAEGRLILFRWSPAGGAFDGEKVRALYEESFAHAYCAQLLKELDLDWNFLWKRGERYTLTSGGIARIKGRTCCKLFGLDESGAVAMEYYVDTEERNIYCVPGDFWEKGNSEEQIGFYHILHQEGNRGIYNLFYPWLTAVEQ